MFLLDLMVLAISIITDWFWLLKDLWGNFDDKALVFYSFLVLYMTLRLWNRSLQDAAYNPVHDANIRCSGFVIYEKFTFVCSCRSVECIAQVYPDILYQWDNLVSRWGFEQAKQRCEIRIHCTDLDKEACQELVDEIQYSSKFNTAVFIVKVSLGLGGHRSLALWRSTQWRLWKPNMRRELYLHTADLAHWAT